jgi:hypothetical protein
VIGDGVFLLAGVVPVVTATLLVALDSATAQPAERLRQA